MQNLKILNKKQIKEILNLIKKQWDADVILDYAFLQSSKNKIYIINKDALKINLSNLKINSLGLYFAEIKNSEIRLSIEGSQLIGPKAKKNIIELNEEQAKEWMQGNDLEIECNCSGFLIIKHKDDFLGCGKYADKKVFNFIGKSRRLTFIS